MIHRPIHKAAAFAARPEIAVKATVAIATAVATAFLAAAPAVAIPHPRVATASAATRVLRINGTRLAAGLPSARVPAGWYCSTPKVRRCAVQPLMTLDYDVHGMSLLGLTRPGAQVITLTVGHLQLAKASPITGARARVSYDGGHTWQDVTVTPQGDGHFRLTFTAPADALVTTRVTATNAAGGSVTETITNGYGVAG